MGEYVESGWKNMCSGSITKTAQYVHMHMYVLRVYDDKKTKQKIETQSLEWSHCVCRQVCKCISGNKPYIVFNGNDS